MNKEAVLEGLLFVVGEDGLTFEQIEDVLEINEDEAKELLMELKKDYEEDSRGLRIDFLGNRFKLTTKEEHKGFYEKLVTDNKTTNLWDKVVNFKLVYCKEWDMWFEIKVELDEKLDTVKTVFCTQLGQAELSQIKLYGVEINTEDDIARDDYKISIFL